MITPDEKYLHRCLELAGNGLENVAPNPMVGCVIVHNGVIIGEGYHQKFGEAHAEVNAIKSVEEKELLKESTAYVNLEPCCYHGKTPPCTELLIKHQIPKVVIGCIDPAAKVAGKGIDRLKQAGCEVVYGIIEEEAKELNRRFFTMQQKKRPYVILKWAQTTDGYIARLPQKNDHDAVKSPIKNQQVDWISNELSRMLVHKWRSEEQAIMVGTNTAQLDNPMLNVREWKGKDPIRIVLDRSLKLSTDLHLFDQSVSTLVFTDIEKKSLKNVEYLKIDFENDIVSQVMQTLYNRNLMSVIIEGGRQLLDTFIKNNLWDEARIFVGNINFQSGIKAPQISGKLMSEEDIAGDRLIVYRNRISTFL